MQFFQTVIGYSVSFEVFHPKFIEMNCIRGGLERGIDDAVRFFDEEPFPLGLLLGNRGRRI